MKRFNWRAFTSWYITLSFIVMIVSGLILYIAPPGRLAKWTYIPLLGLEKDQWQTIHTIFTFLFIVASGFHLYFNWAIFLTYIKNNVTKKLIIKKELLTSIVVTSIIFILALSNFGPFNSVMELGQSITDSWDVERNKPPIPHAEELTLSEIADLMGKPEASLKSTLQSKKIKVDDSEATLKDLAKENNHSPRELYQILEEPVEKDHSRGKNEKGRGWGRKTIRQLCEEMKINETTVIENLKSKGITATYNSKIKELALEYNTRPSKIVDIIAGKQRNNFKTRR